MADSQTNIGIPSIPDSNCLNKISEIIAVEEKVIETKVDPTIFRVSKALSVFKPEAYRPLFMGLGPYHHIRSGLFEMERHKLIEACKFTKTHLKSPQLEELAVKLRNHEFRIRAHYHMYLDINCENLSWIMALDGLFLLAFLYEYVKKDNPSLFSRKAAHHAIVGDIMMLENQLPIFLLHEILAIQCSSPDIDDNWLPTALWDFCKAVSPLKLMKKKSKYLSQVCNHAHLLDLLYHLIVPKLAGSGDSKLSTALPKEAESCSKGNPELNTGIFRKLISVSWSLSTRVKFGWASKITQPIRAVAGLPWQIVKGLPADMSGQFAANNDQKNTSDSSDDEEQKIPPVEEIEIPSVSVLRMAGVDFCPTAGGIDEIKFEKKSKKFMLPEISLNVSSEAIIRNLVAYEASILSEGLVFTRYTELMNGIIDTVEDVKLLKEKKIIVNSMSTDAEVAELFNGMSKSIQRSTIGHIDKAIDDVNRYFNSRPNVRVYHCLKTYVYGSWQILTLIAAILLVGMMGFQSFCSVYQCSRVLKPNP